MTRPLEPGQQVAWLEVHDSGMRVYRATVESIEPSIEQDQWIVTTDYGDALVDAEGVGTYTVPVDQQIAQEFERRGDGFVIEPTTYDRTFDWDRSWDQDGWERDGGNGYGWER